MLVVPDNRSLINVHSTSETCVAGRPTRLNQIVNPTFGRSLLHRQSIILHDAIMGLLLWALISYGQKRNFAPDGIQPDWGLRRFRILKRGENHKKKNPSRTNSSRQTFQDRRNLKSCQKTNRDRDAPPKNTTGVDQPRPTR